MIAIGKSLGVVGWNLDLEPQVGAPASTRQDAVLYAAFLAQAKKVRAVLCIVYVDLLQYPFAVNIPGPGTNVLQC